MFVSWSREIAWLFNLLGVESISLASAKFDLGYECDPTQLYVKEFFLFLKAIKVDLSPVSVTQSLPEVARAEQETQPTPEYTVATLFSYVFFPSTD